MKAALQHELRQRRSRAVYRVAAVRDMAGGKKVAGINDNNRKLLAESSVRESSTEIRPVYRYIFFSILYCSYQLPLRHLSHCLILAWAMSQPGALPEDATRSSNLSHNPNASPKEMPTNKANAKAPKAH